MTSSKRSSQRQRDLELSRLKREELEKQHEAKLRIAKQRLEIEKQRKLGELEIEQLEEDHREDVAAAALEEIELMTKSSADGSGTGKMSGLVTGRSSVKSKKLVQEWVNSLSAGNMADVANEPSLHFSGSIAKSNQAIVQRPSSTQLPNSHFNLNTLGQVEANTNLPVHEPQEPNSRTNVTNDAHVANNIMQEQRQRQHTPPSPPITFGIPTQLNAPNTARQLSQATMHFDGLQLGHQFPRRSSMPRELNLVSPPRSPPLITLVNAPLALNPQQAHINVQAPPSPVLNPAPPHFPLIPPAFHFPLSPPQALPLHATNPMANNVNPLSPHSPPAQFIYSANVFVPQLIHPPSPQKRFQPQNFVPITEVPSAPPNPNVWRFPAAVPSKAVPLVRTSVNLNAVQAAPLINPHMSTSQRSSHVQAAAGAQNYVTSDFMQANPFSSSTGTAPTFFTPIIPPTYGATFPNPLCWGGPPHPTPSAPSLDSVDLIKQLADAITCKRNDPLPEWKLSQDNGDALQWHEWFGQFKSAIDAQSLTDDVKLTYLKALVTGKAKTAIAEFAYCGVMYKDALKILERKFGQPQAVVSAHVDKLCSFPPLKLTNSDNIINYSVTISSLVGVFKSLSYDSDLRSASLLNTAVQKLPPNLKESWSLFTVKKHWVKPTLLDFNNWLKEKAEAHDLMKHTSSKARTEDNTNSVVKTKVASRTFAANTQSKGTQKPASTSATPPTPRCIVCKGNHRICEWRVFKEMSPTQRAKVVVEAKLCFSCLREKHTFRQCPNPRKCRKDECNSSHNTLLHGAERVYPSKSPSINNNSNSNAGANQSKLSSVQSSSKTTTLSSVSNVKSLLQVTELQLKTSSDKDTTALVSCDTACSNYWVSNDLANRLGLHGTALKLTVKGINTEEVVDTKLVQLIVTPRDNQAFEPIKVSLYVKEDLIVGADVINIKALQETYTHLAVLDPVTY